MISTSRLIGVAKRLITLAIILLTIVACSQADDLMLKQVAAQAEVTLPPPTGPHQTGRMSFHWRDAARAELETSAPDLRGRGEIHQRGHGGPIGRAGDLVVEPF